MKLQFLLAIVCGTVWAVKGESSSLATSSPSIGAASGSNNVQPASSSSSLAAQSRSDQALKSAINQVLGSAVAAAASSLPSSSASTYYTNDLSQFMAAGGGAGGGGEQQKLESRQQLASGSPAAAGSGAPSSSSHSSSSLAIPYQALLQALANSQSSSSPSGQQQASLFPSGSSLNPSIVLSPSSSSSSNGASWALPSSWSSSLGSGSSSGLFQMLRPSQIGGRRSSLTSRLKNFMNSIFYRSESSQPYASASTNSYAYRPAPYGFNPVASGFGGFSSLYGSGSGSGSGSAPFASLFGSPGSQSASAYNLPSGSLYGASSNYRPSFIAMPNMFAAGGEAPGWNSPAASSFAGLGPYSDSRKNFASTGASNYANNGNSGESSYASNYAQDSGRWASTGGANSGPSTSGSNPGAIWSSQYQPQGYGPNSLTGTGSNSERGLSAAAGSSGAGIAANYQEASPSSYYPSYQQRISSLTSTSGASPLASAYAQQAQASSAGISDRMSSAYASAPSTANKSGY